MPSRPGSAAAASPDLPPSSPASTAFLALPRVLTFSPELPAMACRSPSPSPQPPLSSRSLDERAAAATRRATRDPTAARTDMDGRRDTDTHTRTRPASANGVGQRFVHCGADAKLPLRKQRELCVPRPASAASLRTRSARSPNVRSPIPLVANAPLAAETRVALGVLSALLGDAATGEARQRFLEATARALPARLSSAEAARPARGSARRVLRADGGQQDELLRQAALRSGTSEDAAALLAALPPDMCLWIDPGVVALRRGDNRAVENMPVPTLLPVPEDPREAAFDADTHWDGWDDTAEHEHNGGSYSLEPARGLTANGPVPRHSGLPTPPTTPRALRLRAVSASNGEAAYAAANAAHANHAAHWSPPAMAAPWSSGDAIEQYQYGAYGTYEAYAAYLAAVSSAGGAQHASMGNASAGMAASPPAAFSTAAAAAASVLPPSAAPSGAMALHVDNYDHDQDTADRTAQGSTYDVQQQLRDRDYEQQQQRDAHAHAHAHRDSDSGEDDEDDDEDDDHHSHSHAGRDGGLLDVPKRTGRRQRSPRARARRRQRKLLALQRRHALQQHAAAVAAGLTPSVTREELEAMFAPPPPLGPPSASAGASSPRQGRAATAVAAASAARSTAPDSLYAPLAPAHMTLYGGHLSHLQQQSGVLPAYGSPPLLGSSPPSSMYYSSVAAAGRSSHASHAPHSGSMPPTGSAWWPAQ